MDVHELMRREMLGRMYDKMSEEEKRMLVLMTLEGRNHKEVMEELFKQNEKLAEIAKKEGGWATDFLSDVGANILTDSLIAIGRLLMGRK